MREARRRPDPRAGSLESFGAHLDRAEPRRWRTSALTMTEEALRLERVWWCGLYRRGFSRRTIAMILPPQAEVRTRRWFVATGRWIEMRALLATHRVALADRRARSPWCWRHQRTLSLEARELIDSLVLL